jgi:uncharacterized membrane protein YeaQ/YmgE (transglycosylase-associated protein family)
MSFFDLDPIGWMIVGLLAGGLSSLLVGGRAARGCLPNILIGILGGIVGGTLAKGAGYGDPGGFTGSVFVALLGSVLLRLALEFVECSECRRGEAHCRLCAVGTRCIRATATGA